MKTQGSHRGSVRLVSSEQSSSKYVAFGNENILISLDIKLLAAKIIKTVLLI